MKKSDNRDVDLEPMARQFASRHLDIPPTPRDTMALLQQAAEKQKDRPGNFHPVRLFIRSAIAIAACIALILAIGRFHPGKNTLASATATDTPDLGLDLADWDMEFDAIYADLSESLESFEGDANTL